MAAIPVEANGRDGDEHDRWNSRDSGVRAKARGRLGNPVIRSQEPKTVVRLNRRSTFWSRDYVEKMKTRSEVALLVTTMTPSCRSLMLGEIH